MLLAIQLLFLWALVGAEQGLVGEEEGNGEKSVEASDTMGGKGKQKCLHVTINKRPFYKFTEMTKGRNPKPMIDRKKPCWWDNTKFVCAKCKHGGKPCGYPMHRWCQPAGATQGCPGVPNRKWTLSSRGYPCYDDLSDTSCAWCVNRNRVQCKRTGRMLCGNYCAPFNDVKCDGVPSTCLNIPWCGNGATCSKRDGKCRCNRGLVGNGLQCKDPKTGEFAPKPGNQVECSINNRSKFFVFANGTSEFSTLEL